MNYMRVITVDIVAAVGRQKIEFFLLYCSPPSPPRTDNVPPYNTLMYNDNKNFR